MRYRRTIGISLAVMAIATVAFWGLTLLDSSAPKAIQETGSSGVAVNSGQGARITVEPSASEKVVLYRTALQNVYEARVLGEGEYKRALEDLIKKEPAITDTPEFPLFGGGGGGGGGGRGRGEGISRRLTYAEISRAASLSADSVVQEYLTQKKLKIAEVPTGATAPGTMGGDPYPGAAGTLPVALYSVCRAKQGYQCFSLRRRPDGAPCKCASENGVVQGLVSAPKAGPQSLASALNPSPLAAAGLSASTVVTVYYATDRERTDALLPDDWFGPKRGKVSYGTVEVSIPLNHETGALEDSVVNKYLGLTFLDNPLLHLLILKINPLTSEAFFSTVNGELAAPQQSDALIFVHGFNVSFKDAARRTAQMVYDLGYKGLPVLYSWPSQGTPAPLSYTKDTQTIKWSEAYLTQFLDDFLSKTTASKIYLVAHSMGTQALTNSFISLMRDKPEYRARVKEIILAAPDIDAALFKRTLAPALVKSGMPVTIYASSVDKALRLSQEANGYPRAGDSGPGLVTYPGIETIDATDVNMDFLGHSTFADTRAVLMDWHYILDLGLRAKQRAGLSEIDTGPIPYWRFAR